MPGGCELGPRPIDLHLMALRALGADIEESGGDLICRAERLKGASIALPMPSVGATENAMLAACAAEGETVIMNAAREPEIEELQSFLRLLGAEVEGAGTATVCVRGFKPVQRVGHRIMPDRIVSATLLCAVAAAGGEIELRGTDPERFSTVLHSLSECGCDIIRTGAGVRIVQEGAEPKFRRSIRAISFSAEHALAAGHRVLYITERCVFELTAAGLRLAEVYPGVDAEGEIRALLDFPLA